MGFDVLVPVRDTSIEAVDRHKSVANRHARRIPPRIDVQINVSWTFRIQIQHHDDLVSYFIINIFAQENNAFPVEAIVNIN